MELSRFSPAVVLSSLLWMFLFGLLMLGVGYYTRDTVALITHGVETIGKITSYDPHRCGSRKRRRTCHNHTITTDDLGAITLDLHSQYEVGSRTIVTYEAGSKKNVHVGHKPTLSTLDGLQYGAIGLLALGTTMFVIGWHGAVTGLGLTRRFSKVMAYSFFLGLVISVYVWVATQIFGVSSLKVVQAVASSLQSSVSTVSVEHLDFSDSSTPMLPVPCDKPRSPKELVQFDGYEECYYELTTFRRLYPEYNKLSDEALSDSLYAKLRKKQNSNQINGVSGLGTPATGMFDDLIPAASEPKPISVSTGVLHRPKMRGVAPLSIRTRPGFDYYVKLVALPDQTIMTMFIRGGEYFETLVPLGTFEIRYAAGKIWYGEQHRFGKNTAYSKADRPFTFDFVDKRYSGYTLELIMQTSGNLPVSAISPDQF